MQKIVSGLALHKLYTDNFWHEFSSQPLGRKGVTTHSKDETIKAIQELGTIVFLWSKKARTYKFNRKQYDIYKKNLKGYNDFKLCFACKNPAKVRHHLIWLKHGGRNHKKNIVALCKPCHALIHDWLN